MPTKAEGEGAAHNPGGQVPAADPGAATATWNNPSTTQGVVIPALCGWLAILLIFTLLGRPALDAAFLAVLHGLSALSAAGLALCVAAGLLDSARRRWGPPREPGRPPG